MGFLIFREKDYSYWAIQETGPFFTRPSGKSDAENLQGVLVIPLVFGPMTLMPAL
jgi:hypothetical protein